MRFDDLALVQGSAATRATLKRWDAAPWPVLRGWLAGSLAIAVALLLSVWVSAGAMTPDLTPMGILGVNARPSLDHVAFLIFRNSLVLALHALSCLAGFIARSELPAEARRHRGWMRALHDHAGVLAIGFVTAATLFSLVTQALVLAHGASSISAQLGISPGLLLLSVLPHALPELVALFLPLAAWILLSRRGRWDEMLAATIVTTALAVPVIVLAAFVETYVSPHLLVALLPG
jgi:stage II sporulation SpoM-like protein